MRYLRDLTRELGLGPARACEELDLWLKVAKAHPAVLSGGKGDAVRIMTIHASKGLEFPVVAVAECWGDASVPTGILSRELEDGRMLCALATSSCIGDDADDPERGIGKASLADVVKELQEEGQAAEDAEKVRLLYVGVTRAREALVLAIPEADKRTTRLAQGTLTALVGERELKPGETDLEFGGTSPARLRVVTVESHKDDKTYVTADSGGSLAGFDGDLPARDGKLFRTRGGEEPAFELYDVQKLAGEVGFWSPREGTYSYSSAHAAVEAAERRAASEASREAPAGGASGASRGGLAGEERFSPADLLAPDVAIPSSVLDEDEADSAPSCDDPDRATHLGSAFHQLAQMMVLLGGDVPAERVRACEAVWHLSSRQCARLEAALGRWRGSRLRAEVLSHGRVLAEQPFFVRRESAFGDYLEGAIDLLCTDEGSDVALVVDYKTGDAGLTLDEVRERHAMQAELYADVLLHQGFAQVDCAFVCVEREDESDPGQPLVVRYRFGA